MLCRYRHNTESTLARLLETERKLLTHAIRMSAYNTDYAEVLVMRTWVVGPFSSAVVGTARSA